MKRSLFVSLIAVASLALMIGTTGCKRGQVDVTPIPGRNVGGTTGTGGTGLESGNRFGQETGPTTTAVGGGEQGAWSLEGKNQDHQTLQAETIHFDYDSATIKKNDHSKLDNVAKYFKDPANASKDLLVEGHCDERGTEGYNQSLGERRALAAREYLVAAGVPADKVHTISYGETKPVAQGSNEAAWKQNRRCEFVVVTPAQ